MHTVPVFQNRVLQRCHRMVMACRTKSNVCASFATTSRGRFSFAHFAVNVRFVSAEAGDIRTNVFSACRATSAVQCLWAVLNENAYKMFQRVHFSIWCCRWAILYAACCCSLLPIIRRFSIAKVTYFVMFCSQPKRFLCNKNGRKDI